MTGDDEEEGGSGVPAYRPARDFVRVDTDHFDDLLSALADEPDLPVMILNRTILVRVGSLKRVQDIARSVADRLRKKP